MPTLVRYVCKVVLFVLVMAVGGVGVAQSQTDPGVVPSSPEAVIDGPAAGVITPDAVQQSARLYATAEQARPATISGGVEHWFSRTITYSNSRMDLFAEWAFYKINGDETNFFVDTFAVAQGKGDFQIPAFDVRIGFDPYSDDLPSVRLQEYAPSIESHGRTYLHLPGGPVTFSMNYQGASIARTFHASPNTRLHSVASRQNDVTCCHFMEVRYSKDLPDEDYPGVLTVGSVSRWEGGPPWGMELLAGNTLMDVEE